MLKRKFAKAVQENDRPTMEYLIMVFNSDYGHLYKLISDLKTCLAVSRMYKKPSDLKRLRTFLEVIVEQLSLLKLFDFTNLQHKLMKRCIRSKNKVDPLVLLIASLKRTLTLGLKRAKI